MSVDQFRYLARYNRWANARLYDACGQLDDGAYRQSRPTFFGSIHLTLNHILVADLIWLGRITVKPSGLSRLNEELYGNFTALCSARETEDRRIVELCDKITTKDLETDLRYATTSGAPQQTPLLIVWTHFFNHQTHHRGQVHDMLSQTEVAPPPLDLIFFAREVPFGAFE